MITRHLIVPLTVASLAIQVAEVKAQGAFPAPLPGASFPANDSAFPPVNGAVTAAVIGAPGAFHSAGAAPLTGSAFERPPAPPSQGGPSDECMKWIRTLARGGGKAWQDDQGGQRTARAPR